MLLEAGRTVVTQGEGHEVTVGIGVVGTAKERYQIVLGAVTQTVVLAVNALGTDSATLAVANVVGSSGNPNARNDPESAVFSI